MSAYWAQWDSWEINEMHGVCKYNEDDNIDLEEETEEKRLSREDAEGQHFLYLDSFY